ncbi:MAG: hypothetical protein IKX17_06030, partial [Prevotella sp.]|nr:hypothetical protein [Prevotella sp.]
GSAKSLESAFDRHAGTCQKNNFFHAQISGFWVQNTRFSGRLSLIFHKNNDFSRNNAQQSQKNCNFAHIFLLIDEF